MLVTAVEKKEFTPDPLIPFEIQPSEWVFKRFWHHYLRNT